ncbi:hypothetical protein RIF29_25139 [Crotalaria pallida]|uniref:Uncharacterized protein n=1 Tax=Crotalaria pallida TaxID=3830 RepID=A0AAN9ER18_CROPI
MLRRCRTDIRCSGARAMEGMVVFEREDSCRELWEVIEHYLWEREKLLSLDKNGFLPKIRNYTDLSPLDMPRTNDEDPIQRKQDEEEWLEMIANVIGDSIIIPITVPTSKSRASHTKSNDQDPGVRDDVKKNGLKGGVGGRKRKRKTWMS